MLITYMSDLHLEFKENIPEHPKGEVLVLAGDILVKAKTVHIDWINGLEFEKVFYVFGNHEFYRGDIDRTFEKARAKVAPHVSILEEQTEEFKGVRFHGATLWTDFSRGNPMSMMNAEAGMNDYSLIRKNKYTKRFRPQDAYAKHTHTVWYLEQNIQPGDVVITHMAPSFRSIDKRYYTSKLNDCYASELSDLIAKTKPALWFHGHIHCSQDYKVGQCRVLANPRGYVRHGEGEDFSWNKTVEIDNAV